jgi:pimeloyl-ACP methyl ester carboxylesterase
MKGVRTGTMHGGLPYFALGEGPPLVVFSGLTPEHANPPPLGLRLDVQTLKPFAPNRTVYQLNRKPGLAEGASMQDIANDHAEALRKEFDGPVDIIGISTGGSVVQQFAIDHPDLLKRLVLASTACRLGEHGRALQRRMLEHAEKGNGRAGFREISAGMIANPIGSRLAGWGGWLLGPFMMGNPSDLSDMMITLRAEDVFDATPNLGRITAPTLIVCGAKDRFYSPELFRATADGIPNARLVMYEGKGHVGALSGKAFARDVLAFLEAPDVH